MFGFLNLNKPQGVTSRDVVNQVQRLVRPAKAGHAGTLDPLATGVLVVALGPATRLIEYVQQAGKSYRGVFLLGRSSDTEDVEGNVTELPDAPQPSRADIERVLPQFIGRIKQRPPAYSALKVRGRRAYDLARAGQSVSLPARTVEIYELSLREYDYPQMTLEVACGAGTYIRSLGRDIAEALGTAAVMSALVRTSSGSFRLEDACDVNTLSQDNLRERLHSPFEAVSHLPRVTLDEDAIERLACGMSVSLPNPLTVNEVAVADRQGRLRAIVVPREGAWGPARNFPST